MAETRAFPCLDMVKCKLIRQACIAAQGPHTKKAPEVVRPRAPHRFRQATDGLGSQNLARITIDRSLSFVKDLTVRNRPKWGQKTPEAIMPRAPPVRTFGVCRERIPLSTDP
jgi:hypothetical protein